MGSMKRWAFNVSCSVSLLACLLAAVMFIGDFRRYEHLCWTQGQRQYFVELWQGVILSIQNDPSGEARRQEEQVEGASWGKWGGKTAIKYTPRLILDRFNAWSTAPPPLVDLRIAGCRYGKGQLGPAQWQAQYWMWFVPFWWFCVPTSILPLIGARRWFVSRRRQSRAARGLCPNCAYDLRANQGRCPECGWAIPADFLRPNGDGGSSQRESGIMR